MPEIANVGLASAPGDVGAVTVGVAGVWVSSRYVAVPSALTLPAWVCVTCSV